MHWLAIVRRRERLIPSCVFVADGIPACKIAVLGLCECSASHNHELVINYSLFECRIAGLPAEIFRFAGILGVLISKIPRRSDVTPVREIAIAIMQRISSFRPQVNRIIQFSRIATRATCSLFRSLVASEISVFGERASEIPSKIKRGFLARVGREYFCSRTLSKFYTVRRDGVERPL